MDSEEEKGRARSRTPFIRVGHLQDARERVGFGQGREGPRAADVPPERGRFVAKAALCAAP